MRRVCAPPRTDSLVPTNMTSTAILRVCSVSLAATRKGRSRACHFGTTFKSWCTIFFACGGHQMIFLSRLGPGSSPGRAESQLSQVGAGSFLIFSVLNGQRCSSCRAPQPQPQAQAQATQRESTAGAAGRRSEHQRSSVAATAAAAEVTMPPPPCRRRRCRLCCCHCSCC